MQTLHSCNLKEPSVILYIKDCDMKRRLLDLGFVSGARVIPVLDSTGHGMRAYLIKGCKIALRREVSENIMVERGDGDVV